MASKHNLEAEEKTELARKAQWVAERARRNAEAKARDAAKAGAAAAQPKPEPEIEAEVEPEPEAQPEAEAEPQPEFDFAKATPILSRTAPMDNAKKFAERRLYQKGELTTYFYCGKWWQWNGRYYEAAPDARIRDLAFDFLDGAKVGIDGERFRPRPSHASELINCLQSRVSLDASVRPPRWLDERPEPADNLLVFKNCLVNCETGEVSPLSPKLWIHDGLDFDYDPLARCPNWEAFLGEVFPGDEESAACIEEQLGYGMTNDTRFQKSAMWIGQRRSGKSTMARVQEQLVGPTGYAALDFHTWVRTENSHSNIVGKKVGIFGDVRLKPPKQYGNVGYDPGGLSYESVQLLLKITGHDAVDVKTKWDRDPWQGRLVMKVIIISNEIPNLGDPVLPTRFIKLEFKECFEGREDTTLFDQRLRPELPGIANRCLAAYRRLLGRGRFIQPASGLELARKIEERGNPFFAFMNDCIEADDEGPGVPVGQLYQAFCAWCENNDRPDLPRSVKSNSLITKIKEVGRARRIERWAEIKSHKPHGKPRRYLGIRLRSEIAQEIRLLTA